MPEKYFATIMKKTPVNESDYIYTVDSVTAGDIDKETQILTTATGEKYKPVTDFSDFDESQLYYSNIIEVDQISAAFKDQLPFSDAIKAYEDQCKLIAYYVTKTNNGGFILLPIDKRPYLSTMEKIRANPSAYEDKIAQQSEEALQVEIKDEEDEDPFITELQDLLEAIVLGSFSPDELIDIKYRLKDRMDELECVMEAVDMQCESLEEELDKITGVAQEETQTMPAPTPLKPKKDVEVINVDDVFGKVTKVLIAQDKPARRVIVELSRLDRMRKKDYGILLTGESGVGKTLLMSLIANNINRPFVSIDSTQLTAQGFVGRSIEQYLWELYEDCGCDLEKAERAIIYFDEIDKKGSEKKSDISGQAVLNMLLKFLDGTTYVACKNPQVQTPENSVRMSTKNMIVVAGGAFLDVYKQNKKNSIGFSSQNSSKEEPHEEPTIKDFVEKSMMSKEFMGRVPVIVHLNDLDVDGIRRIILESEDSALRIQEEVFQEAGVKLTTKDGYILSVANKALEKKIGARGLNKIITDSTWVAYDEVISHPGEYEEVILDSDTVENENSFQLVKKKSS